MATQEPMAWDEIENDPEFRDLLPAERERVFQGWQTEVSDFLKSQNEPEDEILNFQKASSERFNTNFGPEKTPDSGFTGSAMARIASGALNAVSAIPDAVATTRNQLRGTAFSPAEKPRLEQVNQEMTNLSKEFSSDIAKNFQIQSRMQALSRERDSLLSAPSEQTVAGEIRQIAEGAWPAYGANPKSENTAAMLGRGVGTAALMVPTMGLGSAGIPIAGAQFGAEAYADTFNATKAAAEAQGATGKQADQIASEQALNSAIETGPALAAFLGFGKLGAIAGTRLAGPAASPARQLAFGTGTAIGANVAGGSAIRGLMGGAEAAIPNAETLSTDILMGLTQGRASVVPNRGSDTVRTPIGTLNPEGQIIHSDTPEGIALRATDGLDATKPTQFQTDLYTQPEVAVADVFQGVRRSPEAERLVDTISSRHTGEDGKTDWGAVRDVVEQMQPKLNSDPEFLGVMEDAMAIANDRAGVFESGLTNRGTTSTADVFANVERQPARAVEAEVLTDPSALPAQPSEPTGIRNTIVDPNRAKYGLPEREVVARRSHPEVWENTKALVAQDPTAGRRLVEELKQQSRPLTDAEDALMTHEQLTREQELDAAVQQMNSAQGEEATQVARERMERAQNEVFDVYNTGQAAGTENARGLAARRIMANQDFSLGRMMARERAAKPNAEPLTPEETQKVQKAHQEIRAKETKVAVVEDKMAQEQARQTYDNIVRESEPALKEIATQEKGLQGFLDKQAEAARQRIISRRGKLNVTFDPLNVAGLVDEAIIGASHFARGLRDFGRWSKKMLSEFGDRIKPQLQALYDQARNHYADTREQAGIAKLNRTPQEILAQAGKVETLDPKLVFDLTRAHVRAGAKDLEPVMAAVEADLKKVLPDVTRRQIHDALSGYGKTSFPSKEADLVAVRELKALARLTSQLEDAQRREAPLKTGPQRDKATAKVRELQKQVSAEMRKQGLSTSDPATQLASAHTQRVTRLKNSIEELQANIAAGKRTPQSEGVPWTAEEIALRDQVDFLRNQLDSVLNQPENDKLNNLLKRIEVVTEKLRTKDIQPKQGKSTADTKAVYEAKMKLAALNRELNTLRSEARNTPDARLARAKENTRKRIQTLEKRIAANDYAPKPKKDPVLDRELSDALYEEQQLKSKFNEGVIELKRSQRSLGKKIIDAGFEGLHLTRNILTSGDFPPVFRQGLFSIGRPLMSARATRDAFKAMVSDRQRHAIQREIETRPNAPLYGRSKLYLAKETANLSQQEEAYMGNWLKKLPRWTIAGPLLRASERSYNTFLNRLRADTFDAFKKAYNVPDSDTASLTRAADIINTMTGRANLPGRNMEALAQGSNALLFAPRLMLSRFKLAVGEPLWTGNAKTRAFAAEQYARTLAGIAVIYSLAAAAGYKVEQDPRSTAFGKIDMGNQTYLDPLGGLSQTVRFMSQMGTGEMKDSKGKLVPIRETNRPLAGTQYGTREKQKPDIVHGDMGDKLGGFVRSKLAPVPGAAWELATGKNFIGQKTTPAQVGKNLVVPLSYKEIAQAMEKQGVPKATIATMLNMFGMGLQVYDDKPKK